MNQRTIARTRLPLALSVIATAMGCQGPASAEGEPGAGAPAAPRCRPGPGATGTPTSIDEAVALVNGLPHPVSVTCFLESLGRPLRVWATSSVISLQPSVGRRSPRIFLLRDEMVMSVAVAGTGRDLVELGQFVTPMRTLKGEIGFPAVTDIPRTEPYTRIRSDGPQPDSTGSSCRFCHAAEEMAPQPSGALGFVSDALRPDTRTAVPLLDVTLERRRCDPTVEPLRCELLGALLDHGEVVEVPFPERLPTLFR
jgi:hypothetical protein